MTTRETYFYVRTCALIHRCSKVITNRVHLPSTLSAVGVLCHKTSQCLTLQSQKLTLRTRTPHLHQKIAMADIKVSSIFRAIVTQVILLIFASGRYQPTLSPARSTNRTAAADLRIHRRSRGACPCELPLCVEFLTPRTRSLQR